MRASSVGLYLKIKSTPRNGGLQKCKNEVGQPKASVLIYHIELILRVAVLLHLVVKSAMLFCMQ